MALWQEKHRELSANVTAFSGTGLADFAQVAQTQVLCSHTHSHTEYKSDVIEQTGVTENWEGVRVKGCRGCDRNKNLAAGFIKRSV